MKNLRKINIIIAALLCVAVSVMAAIVSSIKTSGANNENSVVSAATALFDAGGNYTVNSSQITKGAKFDMYNNTWTVVAVNGTTATLWADAPIGGVNFWDYKVIPQSLGMNNTQTVYNTYNSAYYKGTWGSNSAVLGGEYGKEGTSALRRYLLNQETLWGLGANSKILAGPQAGNIRSSDAVITGGQGSNSVYVGYNSASNQINSLGSGTVRLNWNIGPSDKLWVPSKDELQTWNVSLRYSDGPYLAVWTRQANTTPSPVNGGHARSETCNWYAWVVTSGGAFADDFVWNTAGVRPAMNLDISAAQKFTVTWKNWDGTVLKTDYNVPRGHVPSYSGTPTRPAPAGQMYTFSGWSPAVSAITADTTYTAQYSGPASISGTVIWKNWDGSILKTDTGVTYGTTPVYTGPVPTRASTAQYEYTFANSWSPAVAAFTGNTEYTAQFSSTVRTYTISWMDEDGVTSLGTDTLEYGVTPSHTPPTKANDAQYTYTFAGWAPAITAVTGNATYRATYTRTVNTYTITWKSGGGVLRTETVNYGTTPSYTNTPTLEQSGKYLDFIGWRIVGADTVYDVTATSTFAETDVTTGIDDFKITGISAFNTVTASIIFEAVYTTENVYTVLWMGPANDSILQVLDRTIIFYQRPGFSNTATFGAAVPRKQWYAFNGWSIGTNGNVPSTATGLAVLTPTAGDDIESNYTAPYYATITGDTTIYACFKETIPDVTTAPNPIATLKYDGSNQIIINYGQGHNGVMEYTFGSESMAGTNWQSDRLRAKDVGTYYVWYHVAGATNTPSARITVTIAPKSLNASEVTIASIPDQELDRKGVSPQPIVMDKDGVIVTGEWVWENNKAVGIATGTFQPNGNFTVIGAAEEIKAQFNIVDSDSPSLNTQLLKIAFVSLCVIGIISIICVAVVCSRHRIEKSDDNSITE